MNGSFTDRARKVMALARQEAMRLNHDCIGTEHLLLGLIREAQEEKIPGMAAIILENLGISLEAVKSEVFKDIQPGSPAMASANPPFTSAFEKVIEFAMEEAKATSCNFVGTEHLLLGLIRVEEEVSSVKMLSNFGINAGRVRQEIAKLLGDTADYEKLKEPVGGEAVDDIGKMIAEAEALMKKANVNASSWTNQGYEYCALNAIFQQNKAMVELLKRILEKTKG